MWSPPSLRAPRVVVMTVGANQETPERPRLNGAEDAARTAADETVEGLDATPGEAPGLDIRTHLWSIEREQTSRGAPSRGRGIVVHARGR